MHWRVPTLTSLADRIWYALHCLPRDPNGRPPASTVLEARHGLSRGLIGKLIGERQREVRGPTLLRLAQALHVGTEWLLEGRGAMPAPTGLVPPRPGLPASQDGVLPPVDDLPARAAAIAFARACGLDPRAIQAVGAFPKYAYSPDEWLAAIKVMSAELRETGTIAHMAAAETIRGPQALKQRPKK